MSKSLGNGIDPIAVIDKYGADALRFSLEMGVSPGADVRMSEEKIESLPQLRQQDLERLALRFDEPRGLHRPEGVPNADELELCDKWILTKFQETAREITDDLEKFELGLARHQALRLYVEQLLRLVHRACQAGPQQRRRAAQKGHAGSALLRAAGHAETPAPPTSPSSTEEVYGYLRGVEGMLITARWPEVRPEYDFPAEAARMEGVMEVIRTVRNLRAEMNVAPGRRATLLLKSHEGWKDALVAAEGYFRRLAFASAVEILPPARPTRKSRPAPSPAPANCLLPAGRTGGCGKGDRPPAKGQKERRRRDRPRAGQAQQPGPSSPRLPPTSSSRRSRNWRPTRACL